MFGKAFESMYNGSMYGAGMPVFAVWGYVIAHTRDSRVELNPKLLADTLGGTPEEVQKALDYLTSPDPSSRHKLNEGRRLVKEGQFQYFVPTWEIYRALRDEEDRRTQNRVAQQRWRQKKNPLPGEHAAEKMRKNGASQEQIDRFQEHVETEHQEASALRRI